MLNRRQGQARLHQANLLRAFDNRVGDGGLGQLIVAARITAATAEFCQFEEGWKSAANLGPLRHRNRAHLLEGLGVQGFTLGYLR